MDVIVRKSFDAYGGNFAGAESADDVAAGIISFDDSPLGREMSRLCLTYVPLFLILINFARPHIGLKNN